MSLLSRLLAENCYLAEEGGDYRFNNDVNDAYRGDVYGSVRATHLPSKSYVGRIAYAASPREVHIHMIEVDKEHQHHGLATRMMNHLRAEFPKRKIKWGMTTPEGTAFRRSYYSKPQTLPTIDKSGFSY